jgi:3-methyladenine DNA glycosylase AlkD
MDAETYFAPLREALEANANSQAAVWMQNYLKGQFPFYGISSPQRETLLKQFYSKQGYPPPELLAECVQYSWKADQREWQYVGMELAFYFARKPDENQLQLAEYMILNKSWWDTVDYIAAKTVGKILSVHPELIHPYTGRWIDSENIWLKRTSLLFQLKYKKATDKDLLFSYILKCNAMREFFIRKAIGWALREYSKTAPAIVQDFVESHQLQPLSRKEALKIISKKNLVDPFDMSGD